MMKKHTQTTVLMRNALLVFQLFFSVAKAGIEVPTSSTTAIQYQEIIMPFLHGADAYWPTHTPLGALGFQAGLELSLFPLSPYIQSQIETLVPSLPKSPTLLPIAKAAFQKGFFSQWDAMIFLSHVPYLDQTLIAGIGVSYVPWSLPRITLRGSFSGNLNGDIDFNHTQFGAHGGVPLVIIEPYVGVEYHQYNMTKPYIIRKTEVDLVGGLELTPFPFVRLMAEIQGHSEDSLSYSLAVAISI